MKKTANARVLAALLCVIMLGALLAGCAPKAPQASQTPGASAPAKTEAPTTAPEATEAPSTDEPFVLDVHVGSEPNSIDPAINTAVDGATLINHAFEGLMKIDDTGEVVYGQAASHTVSDDGLVYTFKLRDDILWSDGQPVVAEDFVYAWQRAIDPATGSDYNYMIEMVAGADKIMAEENPAPADTLAIRAVDEKTVEITLSVATSYFLEICAFPTTYPVRKDIIEANGEAWALEPETYIGNGPYILKEWENKGYMLYEKNPTYYGVADLGPDQIKFHLMDDNNAILAAYKNGTILFADDLPSEEIDAMEATGELYIKGQLGTYFVCFNTEKAPFDNAAVRKALNLVIDRQYVIDNVSKGGQQPATAFVPTGLSDVEMEKEFRVVGGNYWSADEADYQKNVEEAKALLAEAGYPDGAGFPAFEYMYNNSTGHQAIAEYLQQVWKETLGITATLANQEWNVFIDTRNNGDYQVARHGWLADYNDPISFLDMWVTGGGNNDANYSNPEYDALIAQVKASSDRAERMKLMHQAEDLLMADMPVGPIYYYTDLYLKSPKLEGFYSSPLGYKYFMYTSVAN